MSRSEKTSEWYSEPISCDGATNESGAMSSFSQAAILLERRKK
jgi:hypothetical protein